jgi:DNA-binding MarR family transcriptional regulator
MVKFIYCPNCQKKIYILNNNKLKIISLIGDGEKYINEISEGMLISYKSVYENILSLIQDGFLIERKDDIYNRRWVKLSKDFPLIGGIQNEQRI